MRKLRIILPALLCAALALGPAAPAQAANPRPEGFFILDFFWPGEYNGDLDYRSSRHFTQAEADSMIRSARYWVNFLDDGPSAAPGPAQLSVMTIPTYPGANAGALSLQYVEDGGQFYTPLQAFLTGHYPGTGYGLNHLAYIFIGDLIQNYDLNGPQSPRPFNLESVMVHEMGHALGISANDTSGLGDTVFGQLVNDNGGLWFFEGTTAQDVYGDVWWGGVSGAGVGGKSAEPVPMDNASSQARSHFGLRNGNMSHRLFRNYAYFMEAEMASLLDIGYDNLIDPRRHFGLSVYTDDNRAGGTGALTYAGGFGAWNGVNYDDATGNTEPYALGLHVYGSDNEITVQTKNLRADGEGAAGLRIDGQGNQVTLNGIQVTARGDRGVGALVSYGQGHVLELNGGGIGAAGDAVRFDIGINLVDQGRINPDGYGALALYSYFDSDAPSDISSLPEDLKTEFLDHSDYLKTGPLVERFDVKGSLEGGRSAIYISPNSHVREINILDGAAVTGAIVSDYDDQWGAAAAAGVSKVTALNIDRIADFTVDGAILGYGARPGPTNRFYLGRGLIDLNLNSGKTIFTSTIQVKVNSFNVSPGARLWFQAGQGQAHAVIGANNFNLAAGSLVGFDWAGAADPGRIYRFNPLLELTPLSPGGSFDNHSAVDPAVLSGLNIGGAVRTGYDLAWWNGGRALVLDLSGTSGLDFALADKEQFGGYAASAASAMAYDDTGWKLIQRQRRTRLENDRRNPWNQLLAPPAGEYTPYNHVWASTFYGYSRQDQGRGRDGYRMKTPGVALGYDSWITDTALAGLAFSLGLPDYQGDFVENDGQMVTLAAYGVFQNPDFLDLDLTAGYSWNSYDQNRRSLGQTYHAKYHGHSLRLGAGLGRTLELGSGFSLTPRAGYDFIQLEVESHAEETGGLFPLAFDRARQNLHRFSLGAELDWQAENGLGLVLRGGWGRLSGDLEGRAAVQVLTQGPGRPIYQAAGDALDKNVAEVGLGLDVPLGDDWSLNLDYDGAFSRQVEAHGGEMKLNFRF